MREEIEDLFSLADECREWAKTGDRIEHGIMPDHVTAEFRRLADKLDAIAGRLAGQDNILKGRGCPKCGHFHPPDGVCI